MKSLLKARKQICNKKQLCKLRYHLLGQISASLILAFTDKAQCSFIPKEELPLKDQTPELQTDASELQTSEAALKFPRTRSNLNSVSYQAQDLAPLPSLTAPAASGLDPTQAIAVLPAPAEKASMTRTFSDQSFPSPPLPSSRCWRSTAQCSYTSSKAPLLPIPPTEGQVDPEIGDLRLSPIPKSELGELNIQPIAVDPPAGTSDPELGTLRLQERTAPQPSIAIPSRPRQTSAFLLARADYFKTSNVFSERDPVDDGLIRTGLTFFYAPPIGRKTFLITSIDANLVRYAQLGRYRERFSDGTFTGNFRSLNYDELRFRVGVFHRITPRVSGEIGWSHQKLVESSRGLQQIFSGKEFFNDHSLRLELSRQDQLSPRLSLNTFYQFRWSIADPDQRSRILNSFITTLGYRLNPRLQTAIDYQFTWSHFTQIDRDDLYHQLVARVTYNATPRTQVNLFSGFSFGNSTERGINFNGFIFGAGLVFNLPLF